MNYLPNTSEQREEMLREIGVNTPEELFGVIPSALHNDKLNLAPAMDNITLENHLGKLSASNTASGKLCFMGGGAYDRYTPSVVEELLWKQEFYTAYTPYQAERSQGTLTAIFEFQTMMAELAGLEVSNASLYDAPASLWEAVSMANQALKGKRNTLILPADLNPRYRKVVETYAVNLNLKIETIPLKNGAADIDAALKMNLAGAFCLVTQNPGYFGRIADYTELNKAAAEAGCVPIIVADPLALGILKSPGEMSAEIYVGEGQSLGLPLGFGGPYLGIIATIKKHLRKLPGRIAGETEDKKGRRGFVLTLQAREQHIKREKATSSVCSNQALCALAATIYLTCLGPEGLKEMALANVRGCARLKKLLSGIKGVTLPHTGAVFNEFVFRTEINQSEFISKMSEKGILAGIETGEGILTAVTEKRTDEDIDEYVRCAKEILG